MNIGQATDLTRNSFAQNRITDSLRPLPGTTFARGMLLQFVALDSQVWIDYRTVQPVTAGVAAKKLAGVVSEEFLSGNTPANTNQPWGGFDGAGTALSGGANLRGSQGLPATIRGQHTGVLLDQSGTAATITDGVGLQSSDITAGYMQGIAAPVAQAYVGFATLPAAGIGSSLTAAALAQGTAVLTVATPASGDTMTTTFQIPDSQNAIGTAQTASVSTLLNATTGANATAAAAQHIADLKANAVFAQYYTCTASVGAITVKPNGTALWTRYFASMFPSAGQSIEFNVQAFVVTFTGSAANGATMAGAVTGGGGTTYSAGGNIASGTGFKGQAPAFIRMI